MKILEDLPLVFKERSNEEKILLFKEIMSRYPYGVKVMIEGESEPRYVGELDITHNMDLLNKIKICLRPLLDMTDDEKDVITDILNKITPKSVEFITTSQYILFGDEKSNSGLHSITYSIMGEVCNYLTEHLFDYNLLHETHPDLVCRYTETFE